MRQIVFIAIFSLFVCGYLGAQTIDSTDIKPSVMETTVIPSPDINLDLPNSVTGPRIYDPKKALLWSIIPGGGQVYNRRWWKVPLVFSAFSGVAAVLNFNNSNYKRFETAYQAELAGFEHEFSDVIDGSDRLKVFRDNFNKSRQTGYFYLLGIYILQSVEAYVDTQLRDFDLDEDLSQFQLQPIFIPSSPANLSPVIALELRYTF